MVPKLIIQRTFRINYAENVGTAFTIEINSKQYLITAKHIVEHINTLDSIFIHCNQSWMPISCKVVGIGGEDHDIAVLSLSEQISPVDTLLTDIHYYLGQDVYFLGFPYGFYTDVKSDFDANLPIPFVKKAIISGFNFDSQKIYLDGHNNPGFSGGPVFYQVPGYPQTYAIAGVISGFTHEEEPIFNNSGSQTEYFYKYNTGIIEAVAISVALKFIKENPIGFLISDQTS